LRVQTLDLDHISFHLSVPISLQKEDLRV